MGTKVLKGLKAAVLGPAITVMSVIPAYADTYIEEDFIDYNGNHYGYCVFDVDYESGMRNVYAWAGGLHDCEYRIELITTYSYGSEEEYTGFTNSYASISHDYEWAEDYQSTHYVRSGIVIVDINSYSGS